MKLEQLQLLIDIAEYGSMNEVAKNNYTARSSISTAIKNLENELNGKILDRNTKGVSLTPFGVDVYRQAKDILERVNFLKHQEQSLDNINLSITSLYCSLAYDAFINLYKIVDRKKMTADIQEHGLIESIRLVETGICDIGVISLFAGSEAITLKKINECGLVYSELMKRKLYAVIGEKNPLFSSEYDGIWLFDLRDYPYIVNYESVSEYSWESFLEDRKRKRADVQVADLGVALKLVEQTDGYLIETYDKLLYTDFYGAKKYRFIPIKDDNMTCGMGYIRKKDRPVSTIAQEYINVLIGLTRKSI